MNNLQELLKDLKDIHMPAPVSAWPPAIGWWLLPLVVILLVYVLYRWWKKSKTPNYRKLALQELRNIRNQYEIDHDTKGAVGAIALLIRKAMVARFGNETVAGLLGEEWLNKLDEIAKSHAFSNGPGRALLTAPYEKNAEVDMPALFDATKHLLDHL